MRSWIAATTHRQERKSNLGVASAFSHPRSLHSVFRSGLLHWLFSSFSLDAGTISLTSFVRLSYAAWVGYWECLVPEAPTPASLMLPAVVGQRDAGDGAGVSLGHAGRSVFAPATGYISVFTLGYNRGCCCCNSKLNIRRKQQNNSRPHRFAAGCLLSAVCVYVYCYCLTSKNAAGMLPQPQLTFRCGVPSAKLRKPGGTCTNPGKSQL